MKKFVLIDVCQSDYFRGHHNQVYGIPVDGSLTIQDVINSLDDELNVYELNEYSGFTYKELDQSFELFKTENKDSLNKICFPDLDKWSDLEENEEDDFESCMAFFTLEEEY